ncbi:5-formyltetrahydrofolate cyclo-ligase [Pontiellaceae bacterium B12227]|nr:5-formyltetrahydrofolate cyclo-ligase [Pontiellaceae bacterium B12227]
MISKKQLRQEISEKRRALDSRWVEEANAEIIDRFQSLEVFQSSGIVALYKAIGGEVSLEPLFSNCWERGQRTCIPVFNEATRLYEMAEIEKSTPFRRGHYGIEEPMAPRLLNMEQIDLIAVPGVGFDAAGNRLGRGGGYYDRILAELSGISVGIAFNFQIYPAIPHEMHDKPVDFVVTETKFLKA